jgi:heat shock protein HtpX
VVGTAAGGCVFNIGTNGAAWRDAWMEPGIGPARTPGISFALVPVAARRDGLQYSRSGAGVIVDLHLPTDRASIALRCRIDAGAQNLPAELAALRQHAHRAINHQHSGWLIAGMVLLLAACGFVIGGEGGARNAVTAGIPRSNSVSREAIQRWFGARLLGACEFPELFHALADICRRARLSRLPDLYYIAHPNSMNAYALGGPDGSAIVLTDGLLRGMTLGEIAGILAHEIGHICNNDAWAMGWAAALQQTIESVALAGLAALRARNGAMAGRPFDAFLHMAPSLGRLLCLALSRIRELDADATALALTGDSLSLVAALDKLERHHTGLSVLPVAAFEDGATRFLRSHPATAERVGTLLSLAH